VGPGILLRRKEDEEAESAALLSGDNEGSVEAEGNEGAMLCTDLDLETGAGADVTGATAPHADLQPISGRQILDKALPAPLPPLAED
jgi:hypothetical protein